MKFPWIKRWAPLIGTAIVAGSTVATAMGRPEVAQALDTVGALTGLSGQAIVTGAAATSIVGICLKIASEITKAWKAPSIQ